LADPTTAGVTVVVVVAVLFPVLGSATALPMVAVFVTTVAVVGVTTIVTVALPPLAIVPIAHDTVPATWVHVPCDGVAEPNATPPGKLSVMMTPVAESGPALLAVRP
jgi:hypothetical protein